MKIIFLFQNTNMNPLKKELHNIFLNIFIFKIVNTLILYTYVSCTW